MLYKLCATGLVISAASRALFASWYATLSWQSDLLALPGLFFFSYVALSHKMSDAIRSWRVAGMLLSLTGALSNLAVFAFNRGYFPVSGYSLDMFNQFDTKWYYVWSDGSAPLALLADHAAFRGASVGDMAVIVGFLVVAGSMFANLGKGEPKEKEVSH